MEEIEKASGILVHGAKIKYYVKYRNENKGGRDESMQNEKRNKEER